MKLYNYRHCLYDTAFLVVTCESVRSRQSGRYAPDATPGCVVVESLVVVVPGQLKTRRRGHIGQATLQLNSRPRSVELLPELHTPLVQYSYGCLCVQ